RLWICWRRDWLTIVRPDALTPPLSHGERGQTLKTATWLPFCFYHVQPDALTPTLSHGRGSKQFCFYLGLKRPTLELIVAAFRTQRQDIRRIYRKMMVAILTYQISQADHLTTVIHTVMVQILKDL